MLLDELPHTTFPLIFILIEINNLLYCYEGNNYTGNESEKKQHFQQNKEAYTDRSKSTGRKVGYAAVFIDSTEDGHFQKKSSFTQLK